MPLDCAASQQVTACINHCLVPVPDGAACALDSCDLFRGAGIPNAGVCMVGSACVRTGDASSRVGVCQPIPPNVAPGCNLTSGTHGFNPDDQNECPYGGFCAAQGPVLGSCGPADPLQGSLPGMCRRFARVGERCDGPAADARRGLLSRIAGCNVCEPGARCIAVDRFSPDARYSEHMAAEPPEYRCVRTCQSGSDAECDCAGQTPEGVVRASRCFSAWVDAPRVPGRPDNEGPICVRPQWCALNGEPCGGPQDPSFNCNTTPPPLYNDARCFPKRCCERGALCMNNTCVACVADSTTLVPASRCCINTHFVPEPGAPGLGKCNVCVGAGAFTTSQAACCPGLRYAPVPDTSLGQCIVCRSEGQTASSTAECCPGLALRPSLTDPGLMVCRACATSGMAAASPSECCAGLIVRFTTENPGQAVCAAPCRSCEPPIAAPGVPKLGRCSRGDPTVCPESGITPTESCVRNTPLTETCLPDDEDCDGDTTDIDFPLRGRPCTTPVLPTASGCDAPPGPNWASGTYVGFRALTGHWVCTGAVAELTCLAIPGIDFCSAENCHEACTTSAGCRSFRHQDPSGARITTTGTPMAGEPGTGQVASWRGQTLYRAAEGEMPIYWGENDQGLGCQTNCPNVRCTDGTGVNACNGGLFCDMEPSPPVCAPRRDCLSLRPVTCWNHVAESGAARCR